MSHDWPIRTESSRVSYSVIYINWNIYFKMVIVKHLFILKMQAVECKYLVDVCVDFVP